MSQSEQSREDKGIKSELERLRLDKAEIVFEIRSSQSTAVARSLFIGLVGGGVAVLVSKVFDMLASWYVGQGYQLTFPASLLTALFIIILLIVLYLSGPRQKEVEALTRENDRRLAELDVRLSELLQKTER